MLNGKPVVVLDSDDVLGRCIKRMADDVHRIVGRLFTEEEILTWDFFDTVKLDEHPTLKRQVEELMRSKGWCKSIEPFPGAIEGVRRLETIAEVFVCTSPFGGDFWEAERRQWLYEVFGIKSKRVMQGYSKFLMHAEVFVDDKPKNVLEWTQYNRVHTLHNGLGLLWDRPHNRDARLPRVHTWDELHDLVVQEWTSLQHAPIR